MEVQDCSENTCIPPVDLSSSNLSISGPSASSHASQPDQPPRGPARLSPSSSVDSSPVTGYFDFPPESDAEAGARDSEAAGWSGFSWGSGGSGAPGSYTPPSSYAPSRPRALSRSLDKGKGRQRPTEVERTLVESPVVEDDGRQERFGISEMEYQEPGGARQGQEGGHVREGAGSALADAITEEVEGSLSPLASTSRHVVDLGSSSPPALTPTPSPPPKRPRTLSIPRALRLSSRNTTSLAPADTSETPPRRRFVRSVSSLSDKSRPTSFLSLTPSRSKTPSSGSGASSPARPRQQSNKRILKALSFIRPTSQGPTVDDEPISPSAERPPRFRSHSAPFLQTLNASSGQIIDQDAYSPFVTALSTPISETPHRLPTPVQLRLNLFDFLLPREVRLRILGSLVEICVEEHEKDMQEGKWKGQRGRERWVGELKGRRELVRVSSVSRTWHALAFDGQHWQRLPSSLFGADLLSTPFLLRLVGSAGTFLKALDLTGMGQLQPETLVEITQLAVDENGETSFSSLNLTGCHSLTTASLAYLLEHSPNLHDINLFALACVDHSTLELIGSKGSGVKKLNVNRCRNLGMAALSVPLGESRLEELHVSGIGLTNEGLLEIMRSHPRLKVLDISHSPLLSDAAFCCLVRGSNLPPTLPSRDLKPAQKQIYALLRLNMSSLPLISDASLRYLAHCLPSLTHLELGDSSRLFHGPGLIRLLNTTPSISHLDLEHCLNLQDETVLQLPPTLRHLNVSSCRELTEDVWDQLVAQQPLLERLEADGTSIQPSSAYAFVASRRQVGTKGALLSVLDNRAITRQAHKQGQAMTRPRTGQRGYWTTPLAYHDGEEGLLGRKGALEECDESRVVVRSFYGSEAVDSANARRKTNQRVAKVTKVGRRRGEGERGMSCIVS